MKIDRHIYFTNEEYARISDYKEKNKLSFSEAVCFLSISALNSNDILDRINFLDSRLDYLIKKINIIYFLMKYNILKIGKKLLILIKPNMKIIFQFL